MARLTINDFGYNAGGWRVENHLRLVADVTGDGTGDVVGFGNDGVVISLNNNNNTFQPSRLVLRDFGYNSGGWRIEKHPRFLSDLRRTGRADIVGFGDAGVLVAVNNGGGTFRDAFLALKDFGYTAGWRVDKHLRLLGDTNGDGYPDIIGFGDAFVFISRNNQNGTFLPAKGVLNDFCYNAGWRVDKHPRFLADLTGDGRVDIIGFGDAGVYTALNNGNGTFQPVNKVIDEFGYNAGGWRVEKHPRFIADLTGDGRGDIVGFSDAGVRVSYNKGDGTFEAPKLVVADFGYVAGGWRVEQHPRFLADLTGDGCADIIGFANAGVYVAFNDGAGGFGPVKLLIGDFGYDGGWRLDKHVRYPANLYA
jgi:FG-GAP-like repeat